MSKSLNEPPFARKARGPCASRRKPISRSQKFNNTSTFSLSPARTSANTASSRFVWIISSVRERSAAVWRANVREPRVMRCQAVLVFPDDRWPFIVRIELPAGFVSASRSRARSTCPDCLLNMSYQAHPQVAKSSHARRRSCQRSRTYLALRLPRADCHGRPSRWLRHQHRHESRLAACLPGARSIAALRSGRPRLCRRNRLPGSHSRRCEAVLPR